MGTKDLLANIRDTYNAEIKEAELNADPNETVNETPEGESIQTEHLGAAEETPAQIQARGEGWMPEKEWVAAGKDPDMWKPAGAFLADGQMRKEMRGLKRGLTKRDKLIDSMIKERDIVHEAGYNKAMADLKAQRDAAIENDDMKTVVEVSDKMAELREHQKAEPLEGADADADPAPTAGPSDFTPAETAEIQAWAANNAWYVMDQQLGSYADVVASQYMDSNDGVSITDALNYAARTVRQQFPSRFGGRRRGPAPVDGGPANRGGPAPADNVQVLQPSQLSSVDDYGEELYRIYTQYKRAGMFKKDENDKKGKWTYKEWAVKVGAVK